MHLTSLTFRETVKTSAEYGELVAFFKRRLGEKYFKGFIGKDETELFSYTDFFSPSFTPSLPVIQIKVKNKVNDDGEIEIDLKLVNLVLISFCLAIGIILFFAIEGEIPISATIFILVFSYGFLLFFYRSALREFKRDIKSIQEGNAGD